jgi:hypothetical protein
MIDRSTSPDPGDAELRRRLEAYAELRLSPDDATVARVRSRVMARAHRRSMERAAVPVPSRIARSPRSNGITRRLVGGVVAASLTLALVTGSVSASQPGGPLYPVRVWAESMTLPSDSGARANAELARLQTRIDEATTAAAAGDERGIAAALDAYRSIVAQAESEAGGSAPLGDRLEAELDRHVHVLERLLGTVSAESRKPISAAISGSGDAIDRVGGEPARRVSGARGCHHPTDRG